MKLIVRAPNWVGDAVMALPAVDNARDITGASHIAVMARKATAPLFKNHPDVDRIVVIDDQFSRLTGPIKAAAMIKSDQYDIGLILPSSFSSALIFRLAGVTGRIGYAGDKRSLLLSRAVKPPGGEVHRARRYLYLLEQWTGKTLSFRSPRVYLDHENIAAGEAALSEFVLSYDDRYLAVAPRAVAESRRWGSENYGRLCKRLIEKHDCRVVLIGTDDDRQAGEEVRAGDEKRIINLCGRTDLMAAAAILSFANLFVGNDSGLAHLAGAVDCPLVVLSGPDNPAETSPLTDNKKVIIKDIDCIKCVKNICPKTGDDFMRCMKLITVDEVTDAAAEIFKY